ncbi:MAG: hypothetical protein QXR69_02020 [Conexivisphaerales archaeon]
MTNGLSSMEGKTLLVGVGRSGCKIVQEIKQYNTEVDTYYVTTEQKYLPSKNDFLDWRRLDEDSIRGIFANILDGTNQVVVFGGLGGRSGSLLIPRVVSAVRGLEINCCAIVLLPFEHQSDMEYTAGASLARIRKKASSLIIIDRQQFVEESFDELPLEKVYEGINSKIANIVASLLKEDSRIFESLMGGETILEIKDAGEGFSKAVSSITRRVVEQIKDDTDNLLVVSSGNRPTTLGGSKYLLNGFRSLVSQNAKVRYINAAQQNHESLIAVLAHSQGGIKLRVYDPVDEILGDKSIDDDPESGFHIPLMIERID